MSNITGRLDPDVRAEALDIRRLIRAAQAELDTLRPTAWTAPTLLNLWAAGSEGVRYRKVGDVVSIYADVNGGSWAGSPSSSVIFTLPVGFRPARTQVVMSPCESPGATVAVVIYTNGNVTASAYYTGITPEFIYLPETSFSTTL